jgi:Raf kinase inhibitor-like YbhB/YbcL family protein
MTILTQRQSHLFQRTSIQTLSVLLLMATPMACRRASVKNPSPGSIKLTSSGFRQGEGIPQRFTCKGANTSPGLSWSNLPPGTKSLALVVSDPDSFLGSYVHWVLYNLPPEADHLDAGVPTVERLPNGARQGMNSGDAVGYTGPCPPGRSPHRYVFTLYAVDGPLSPASPVKKELLMQSMDGHVLASGELTGHFPR